MAVCKALLGITLRSHGALQPLSRPAEYVDAIACQIPPYFVGAVDPLAGLPYLFYLGAKFLVAKSQRL